MSISPEILGWLIKKVQYRHHRRADAALAAIDISLVQWNALREIERHPNASMHQLAELTFNSDQAFGTLSSRLLRLGLVTRSPGGGRITHHRLTAKGHTLYEQGRLLMTEIVTKSFAHLSVVERNTLHAILTKITNDEADIRWTTPS